MTSSFELSACLAQMPWMQGSSKYAAVSYLRPPLEYEFHVCLRFYPSRFS